MTRTPACEDAATISARLRELRAERMAAIAGCLCGTLGPSQRDVAGNLVHAPQCPLRATPAAMASQLEQAREAMRRARARLLRGQPSRLILPTDLALTDDDMAELRAIWILQTQCPAELPLDRADEIIAEGVAAKYARHRILIDD